MTTEAVEETGKQLVVTRCLADGLQKVAEDGEQDAAEHKEQ